MADILGTMQKRRSGVIIGAPKLDANGNPIIIPAPTVPSSGATIRGSLTGSGFGNVDPTTALAPSAPKLGTDPYFTALQNVALENKTVKKDRSYGYGANFMGGGGLLGMGGSIYRRSLLGIF